MKKRILAIILAASIIFTFAGCSSEELGFYSTVKNMINLKENAFEGTISATGTYKINAPTEAKGGETPLDPSQAIQDALAGKVHYDGLISADKNEIILNVTLEDKDGKSSDLFKVLALDKAFYVSQSTIERFKESNNEVGADEDEPELTYEEPLGNGVKYAKFTFQQIGDQIFDVMKSDYPSVETQTSGTGDYKDGYEAGFNAGVEDGYFAIQKGAEGSSYGVDEEATADYKTGYDAGYAAGTPAGVKNKTDDTASNQEIKKAIDGFVSRANVTNLIKYGQSIGTKAFDQIVTNFCKDLKLDVVKKDGDNKYSIKLDAAKSKTAMETIMNYLTAHTDAVVPTVKAFFESLSADELSFMGIDDQLKQKLMNDLQDSINNDEAGKQLLEDNAPAAPTITYNYVVEKTGGISYKTNEILTMVEKDDFSDINIEVKNEMTINKSLVGDVKTAAAPSKTMPTSAVITLDINDVNAVEAGIVYSTSADFSNPVIVKAVKGSDGKYTVDISGLKANQKYYYKTYTIDAGGNRVFSSTVSSFTTVPNPETGSEVPYYAIFIAALALGVFIISGAKKKVTIQ